jgi:hypothetical protein
LSTAGHPGSLKGDENPGTPRAENRVNLFFAAAALLAFTTPEPNQPPSLTLRVPVREGAVPISIRSCLPAISKAGSLVWITFVNRANVVASDVRFRVNLSSGDSFEVTERGTFSPAVDIEHAFRLPNGTALTPFARITCDVSYAHFENGTAWAAASSS